MPRPKYPSDETEKLLVRFPSGMRERLKEVAGTNHRSMNGEVVAILEKALFNPPEMKKLAAEA